MSNFARKRWLPPSIESCSLNYLIEMKLNLQEIQEHQVAKFSASFVFGLLRLDHILSFSSLLKDIPLKIYIPDRAVTIFSGQENSASNDSSWLFVVTCRAFHIASLCSLFWDFGHLTKNYTILPYTRLRLSAQYSFLHRTIMLVPVQLLLRVMLIVLPIAPLLLHSEIGKFVWPNIDEVDIFVVKWWHCLVFQRLKKNLTLRKDD